MNEERDQVFIDVKSADSVRSLTELVDDAYNEDAITVCQYRIGSHIPMWRPVMKGDPALYAIDDIGAIGGEITYIIKRAFRPRWFPDNEKYKELIHFAHGMSPKIFGKQWVDYMVQVHNEAIDRKRWLFIIIAMIEPHYRMDGNRGVLLQKAKDMADAEDELDKEAARMALGDCFAEDGEPDLEGEGYAG